MNTKVKFKAMRKKAFSQICHIFVDPLKVHCCLGS